jgi:small subunit ribosomal protein S17
MATNIGTAVRQTFRELHGVVVTAGLMQKTAKVRVGGQRWNNKVKKV